MLASSGGGLILYQTYGNLYAMTGRKAHLLEDKQIPSVGVFDEVFSIWKAFGGNTRDLGSFGEETDETTDLHQHLSRLCSQRLETASQDTRDAVAIHPTTEIGKSSRIDDKVVQDQRQQDDNDLQDHNKEEEVEPRRSKRARTEKSFGPNFISFMVKNEPTSYREAVTSSEWLNGKKPLKVK
ncbi:hypothetical protein Tco_0138396 [Tanacetum coccineum]